MSQINTEQNYQKGMAIINLQRREAFKEGVLVATEKVISTFKEWRKVTKLNEADSVSILVEMLKQNLLSLLISPGEKDSL